MRIQRHAYTLCIVRIRAWTAGATSAGRPVSNVFTSGVLSLVVLEFLRNFVCQRNWHSIPKTLRLLQAESEAIIILQGESLYLEWITNNELPRIYRKRSFFLSLSFNRQNWVLLPIPSKDFWTRLCVRCAIFCCVISQTIKLQPWSRLQNLIYTNYNSLSWQFDNPYMDHHCNDIAQNVFVRSHHVQPSYQPQKFSNYGVLNSLDLEIWLWIVCMINYLNSLVCRTQDLPPTLE